MRMIRLTSEYIERIVAGESALRAQDTGPSALALGSFDGLHLGHQALIRAVREAKERHGLRSCGLFTFRRHPSLVLGGRDRPFLLTTWREKLALLDDAGLDIVVAASFSPVLAQLDYRRFVREFLVEYLGMKHFVAGYDVHLGAGRAGNARTLADLGDDLGYTLEVVPPATVGDRTVSSSAIRADLEAGDTTAAAQLLGRPYALWGEVTPGDGRGRTIGYPTANVESLDVHKLLPAPGVYAVRVQVPGDVVPAGGNGCLAMVEEGLPEVDRHGDMLSSGHARWRIYGGMLNFGRVPTFHTGGLAIPRIEVHIFDFAGDLRGRTVKVEWLDRLRDEQRFGGVVELVAQLGRDEAAARAAIAAAPLPGH
jgi:riboflavin kinase / FMN adenylyltransferase